MHKCTLSTIATFNNWERDPKISNKVQIRKGDIVREVKRSRSTVVCYLYKDNFKTSVSIKEKSFKSNFIKTKGRAA